MRGRLSEELLWTVLRGLSLVFPCLPRLLLQSAEPCLLPWPVATCQCWTSLHVRRAWIVKKRREGNTLVVQMYRWKLVFTSPQALLVGEGVGAHLPACRRPPAYSPACPPANGLPAQPTSPLNPPLLKRPMRLSIQPCTRLGCCRPARPRVSPTGQPGLRRGSRGGAASAPHRMRRLLIGYI